ncbi:MAG: leucine-rich repeat protein [Prevotellaceae bacterium]|jgi:hypothetical protein|nr:leucine-rich repeat protein [Prevotellaceae bacterium]
MLKKVLKKSILSLAIFCGLSAGANAQSFNYNGIEYEVTSTSPKEVKVKGNYANSAYSGAAVIPNSVEYNSETYAVTAIGSQAFFFNSTLTSVTIGNSVKTIEFGAFYLCSNLTSVTIGSSVETIGQEAFVFCMNLSSVTIGSSVKTIGEAAFHSCLSLSSVTIGNSVETIEKMAFYLCSSLSSVTIGSSVKTIGEGAFYNCKNLTSVTISNSVETIGKEAFRYCLSLTSVTIGSSVETIGQEAFAECSNLTSVTIGSSVETIGTLAFTECSKLASVTISNSVKTIGEGAFAKCSGLTSVTIGSSVETIGIMAFTECSGLTSVTISSSVKTIGIMAFAECSGLTSVTIGSSVETIGEGAFAECSGLETIYVNAITPPVFEDMPEEDISPFLNVMTNIPVYVPCNRVSAYVNATGWDHFNNYIDGHPLFNLTVQSEDENKGLASITEENTCSNNEAKITATPLPGYQFAQWSDGNTENPRTVTVTEDMTLTATFSIITGIDGTQATALALYPNPVRDELFISGVSGNEMVVITDLSGRMVEAKNFSPLQNGNMTINVSHLPQGIYFVKIGNAARKFIKE